MQTTNLNGSAHLEEIPQGADQKKRLAFIIGAAKCATTSLWFYLSQHPQVFGHPLKETKFFYRQDGESLSGEQLCRSYLDIYERTKDPKMKSADVLLEATPGNFFNPKAARRIASACPNAKLLVIVRDPVKRAFSEWQMRHRDDTSEPPVELFTEDAERDIARLEKSRCPSEDGETIGALDWDRYLEGFDLDDPKGRAAMQPLIGRGMYADQACMWLQYFRREQLFFLDIVDLKKEVIRARLKGIAHFLDIDPTFEWPEDVLDEKMNQGGNGFNLSTMASAHRSYKISRAMDNKTETRLYEFFEPHNRRFFKTVGRTLEWSPPPTKN